MPSIHLERLEVTVRGIDPATVRSALGALPASLSAEMARRGGGDAGAGEALRFAAAPGPEALARRIAGAVAAEIRARGG